MVSGILDHLPCVVYEYYNARGLIWCGAKSQIKKP